MAETLKVAVLVLGEAGSHIADRLAAHGASVVGYDISLPTSPSVPLCDSLADAVSGANLVFSTNTATAALSVAKQAAAHLSPGAIYVDANSGNPGLKQRIADEFPENALVDVAIVGDLSDVNENAVFLAAGPAANGLAERLAPYGLDLEVVSAEIGQAAARALTRSLVSTFIASALVDYMWAAQAMGLDAWAHQEMLAEFDKMDGETATRLMHHIVSNPKRREIEMLDIVEMLESVGYHSLFVPPSQLVYNKVYHSIKVPFVDKG